MRDNGKAQGRAQVQKFKAAARDLGTDADPERFKETVRKMAPGTRAPVKSGTPKSK
jgi:hypothetical protein